MVDALNPSITTATQWFERTLDDSANKRVSVAEGFLAVDAILNIYAQRGRWPGGAPQGDEQHVWRELPFMASENIMMEAVEAGRQPSGAARAPARQHAIAAGKQVKELKAGPTTWWTASPPTRRSA